MICIGPVCLTQDILFKYVFKNVLVRTDLDLALQVWRAIQFDAVAHDAPELAADGEEYTRRR